MDSTITIKPLFFFNQETLMQLGREKSSVYQTAEPFQHIVMDNFLPQQVLDDVLNEFPGPEQADWHIFNNAREKKLACQDESQMGPHIRHLISQLSSMTFLNFLTDMTGIDGLVQDPYFHGGGMHQLLKGGKLNVHADFNWHNKLNMKRRLNLLLYLNKDWSEEYGGHLELWDRGMKKCVKKILPIFNRCVIFSTNSDSFHGNPAPVTCPENRSRKSIALYYYTSSAVRENSMKKHPTLFQARPEDSFLEKITLGIKYFTRKLVPPIAMDLKRTLQQYLERYGK